MKHFTLFVFLAFLSSCAQAQGMLEKIRNTRAITVAHRDASIPFSYLDANGQPIGYAMDLCLKIVDAIKRELKLPALDMKFLKVTSSSRIPAITQGQAALECGSTNLKTLERVNAERALRLKIMEAADHAEAFGMVQQKKADALAMDDVLLFGLRANSS